ncbi:MAG: S8 family serine peptidase [Nitrososphaerales archaeon]
MKSLKVLIAFLLIALLLFNPLSLSLAQPYEDTVKPEPLTYSKDLKMKFLLKAKDEFLGKGRILARVKGSENAISELSRFASLSLLDIKDGMVDTLAILDPLKLEDVIQLKGLSIQLKFKPVIPRELELNEKYVMSNGVQNLFKVREALGVKEVNEELKIEGKGVRVALVDTGVDYSHPDLRDALEYVELEDGTFEPLVLDADESQVLMLEPYSADEKGFLRTKDKVAITLLPDITPIKVKEDYFVKGIPSNSGTYRFGVSLQFPFGDPFNILSFGVLLADPEKPLDYTLAIPDLNRDYNFTNDPLVYYKGDRIISLDLNGDGFPELSGGVVGGFFYDVIRSFSFPPKILAGWDRKGNYLSIFYDFIGHGTTVAGIIASDGKTKINIEPFGNVSLPGIAPSSKIVGIKALWLGNVEIGMLWAAGFEIRGGALYYTGQPKADIINNSWGTPFPLYDIFGPSYDLQSMLVNGLMVPKYLDPNFPGILIVQAAGNGGFGYGTITPPATASLILSVGSSTSTHAFANLTSFSKIGSYDDVIAYSSRGPNTIGQIKPDIVAPGSFAASISKVEFGGWIWFGGTSLSTAITSGVASLVLEASEKKINNPLEVKAIMQAGSKDLGLNPFVQGSGRLDALKAVLLAKSLANRVPMKDAFLYPTNSEGLKELEGILKEPWKLQWLFSIANNFFSFHEIIPPFPSNIPKLSNYREYSLFLGRVEEGSRKNFSIKLYNPSNQSIYLEKVKALKYSPVWKDSLSGFLNPSLKPSDIILIDESEMENFSLLRVAMSVSYENFDPALFYFPINRYTLSAFLWKDFNADQAIQEEELTLLNLSNHLSTTNEVLLSNIKKRMVESNSKLVLKVDVIGSSSSDSFIPYNLSLMGYNKTIDPHMIFSINESRIEPRKAIDVLGELTLEEGAYSGAREGIIELIYNSKSQYIPYSYMVVSKASDSISITPPSERDYLYDLGSVRGGFNWLGSYEAGDWRFYTIKVEDLDTFALEVNFTWQDKFTTIDIITLGPDGQFAGVIGGDGIGHSFFYLGRGRFLWHQTVGKHETFSKSMVTFPLTSYLLFQYPFRLNSSGVFTIMIHEVIHGGSKVSEEIKGTVKLLKLKDRERMNLIKAKRGEVLEAPGAIQLPYNASVSSDSPFFDWFSMEVVGLTSSGIGFAPSVKVMTSDLKAKEVLRVKDIGLSLFIPRYAQSDTYLALIVFIPSFPELKLKYIFLGSLREYSLSPLYFFQEWYIIRVE